MSQSSLSMYDATVSVFARFLNNLSAIVWAGDPLMPTGPDDLDVFLREQREDDLLGRREILVPGHDRDPTTVESAIELQQIACQRLELVNTLLDT